MEIRRMTTADAEAVAVIEKNTFSDPWSKQGFLDTIALPESCCLVAVWEGQICGYCIYYRSFEEAEIVNVAVAETFRNKKIGSALLDQLLFEGRKEGVRDFFLEVRVTNEAAIALYKSHGFQKEGIRKNFYENPREDAYVLRLGEAVCSGSISH